MRKLLSFIATSAILLNSFYAPLTAIAQEITPTPEPTPEATSTPEPTQTPEATISPTEEPTVAPESTPTEIASPTPEITVPPTDTGSPEPTEEAGQETQSQDPESLPTTPGPPLDSPEPAAEAVQTPSLPSDENAEITTEIITSELFPETVQENSVIKLITDKLDYTPSEIAIISGLGFIPEKTYSLTVSSSDDPATSTTVDVTADGNGEFTYGYQLDGNYRPNYLVEVKDGEFVIASTTFTDSRSVVSVKLNSVDMVGSNKVYVTPGSTVSVDVTVNITDNSDWQSTGWRISTTAPGSYPGCFNSTNYNSNGDHSTSFNLTAPGTVGTYNVYIKAFSNNTCTEGSTGSFSFNNGLVVVSELPSNTKLYQWETKPSGNWITGNLGSSNSDYKEGDSVPFKLDVGGLSTGTYSLSLCRDYKNGSKYGYYEITSYNATKSPTVGAITNTNGNFSGVNITINSVNEVGGQGACGSTQRETKLVITSSNSATAYVLWGGKLAKPSDPGVGSGNGATSYPGSSLQMQLLSPSKSVQINPAAIIPETPQTGTVELKKVWVGVGGQTTLRIGTSVGGTQTANVQTGVSGGTPLTTGTKTVNAGTYYLSETGGLTGYTSSLSCLKNGQTYTPGASNSIVVAVNDVFVCTFTNTKRVGYLRIEKLVSPTDDGSRFDFNLTSADGNDYDAGGYTLGSGNYGGLEVPIGTHTWTETSNSGYTTTYQCADLPAYPYSGPVNYSTPVTGNSVTFTLQENHEYWCKFINTKIIGSISGMKFNDIDGSTNKNPGEGGLSGWTIYLDSDNDGRLDSGERSTVTDSSGNYSFGNLSPGSYRVREVNKSGWSQTTPYHNSFSHVITVNATSLNHTNIDFGNRKLGSLKIVKDSLPDDGQNFIFTLKDSSDNSEGGAELDDDIGPGSSSRPNNATFSNLDPDVYKVRETPVDGWDLDNVQCETVSQNAIQYGLGGDGVLSVDVFGEDVICTFQNIKRGSIAGYKWNDNNGNGTRDREWHDRYCHYGHCHEGYWGDYTESKLSGWKIFIDKNDDGIYQDNERYDNTDGSGEYYFGNLKPGDYKICEIEKTSEGWHNTSGGICQNVTVGNGETITDKNFGNQRTGSIKVCKVIIDPYNNISNGSLFAGDTFTINWDKGLDPTVFTAGYEPNEKLFSDSEVNDAYCKTISDIPVSTYKYSAEVISNPGNWTSGKYNDQYSTKVIDLGDFYSYGSNTDSNGEINLALVGPTRTLVILNQYLFVEDPKLELTKTNSAGTAIPAGSQVTYTLNIKNSGNVGVNNVEVTDFLPGGFTYVAGSTTGATTNDPVINGGKLTWNIETISIDESIEISYKVQTANDLTNGTYVNYATCNANTQKPRSEFTLRVASIEVTDQNSTSCNTDDSSVKIDNSLSYGGSLGGQVLGASTMLPATGNPTWMLLVAFGLTGTGIYLNIRSRKSRRPGEASGPEGNKNVKN